MFKIILCNNVTFALLRPVYTERQREHCNDPSDTALIENIKWGYNPFWSDCIVFSQSIITRVIAAMMLTLSVNGPLKRVKRCKGNG